MSLRTVLGARVPIRIWTDPDGVEPAAMAQLRNIANLPWVHGLAVMPDVHLGKGATVGSVIAMRQAISPAAVGVDIGCVDAETEYLSPTGWRRINDYRGGQVMEYDPTTGMGRFVEPEAYIVKDCPEFLRLKTKYGIDQMLSPDHRVLCWKITGRERRRVATVMTAAEFADEHERLKQGFKAEFATTFTPVLGTKVDLSDPEIRVQVMANADGHIDHSAISLRVSKPRKIKRARLLLTEASIPFTERLGTDGVTTLRFRAPLPTKAYTPFWGASVDQLRVIADECLKWDGNEAEPCFYTRDRESADFIQYAFTATGRRGVLRADKHHRDGATDYRVFAYGNTMVGMAGVPKTPISIEPSQDGKAYCFTVPSGFWVMRRGGNITMTGNCGMTAVRTSLTAADLPDDVGGMRRRVEDAVPVGFAAHDKPVNPTRIHGLGGGWDAFWRRFADLHPGVQQLQGRAEHQMGTLGGGNHFIEICLEQDGPDAGRVWIMLHSGSRNVGKELAERHMAVARKLPHNDGLPDRELAVFVAGTPEMDAYRRDLFWAQEYARRNRAVILALVQRAVVDSMPDAAKVKFDEPISCHHNYVAEEVYDGVELLVTRKGAIRAGVGELGIIPGSMGTGSYIVRGLGNPEAFCSASHGAGRRMSRAAAKRSFTVDDLAAQTAGVDCRKDSGVVDEIPAAYKDIGQVIADQADLVEVVARLKQVVCVKG